MWQYIIQEMKGHTNMGWGAGEAAAWVLDIKKYYIYGKIEVMISGACGAPKSLIKILGKVLEPEEGFPFRVGCLQCESTTGPSGLLSAHAWLGMGGQEHWLCSHPLPRSHKSSSQLAKSNRGKRSGQHLPRFSCWGTELTRVSMTMPGWQQPATLGFSVQYSQVFTWILSGTRLCGEREDEEEIVLPL